MILSTIYRGFTWRHRMRLLLDGEAVALTADTIQLTIVHQTSGEKDTFTADTPSGLPQDVGMATFLLTPTQTNTLEVGRHWYEISWTLADNRAFLVDDGYINIKQRQTPTTP